MATFDNDNEKDVADTFRNEDVYSLTCTYCQTHICDRGMKSFLIADEKVELFSTDKVDRSLVDLTPETFHTDSCKCHIQNIACLNCGNVVGYHVAMPCGPCASAQNNGHYWMFYRHAIHPSPRIKFTGDEYLLWGDLARYDIESLCDSFYEECER